MRNLMKLCFKYPWAHYKQKLLKDNSAHLLMVLICQIVIQKQDLIENNSSPKWAMSYYISFHLCS